MAVSKVGTILTSAPEVLAGKNYGFEADIWSIGVLYYQMLYEQHPYYGTDKADLLAKIHESEPQFPKKNKKISSQSVDFLKKCLKADPK